MPGESLHAAVEALRTRLQSTLDGELTEWQTRVESEHQQAIASATRAADEAWSARFAAAAAESAQIRTDERARLEAEHAVAIAEARRQSAPSATGVVTQLADAMRRIGQSASLSATLDTLVELSSAHADHVSLYVPAAGAGDSTGWATWGPATSENDQERELVRAASTSGRAETSADGTRLAVPMIVGDRPVAVLHVTRAESGSPAEIVVLLAFHAAASLERLTAVRLTQLMMGTPERAAEDNGSARRYARLLVSEIKLYNEAAVRTGREHGDLLARLGPEIDRARRLYEQRVPASQDRGSLFQHELVQTLAAGDATRLGATAS